MALCCLLEKSADRFPEKICITFRGSDFSFQQINDLARRLAAVLKDTGVKRGERVIAVMSNSPEYVVSYFALMKLGAVCVPLSTQLSAREIAPVVVRCAPVCALVDAESRRRLPGGLHVIKIDLQGLLQQKPAETTCPEDHDLAMIIFTSGTTREPKGVMLSHKNLEANAASICKYLSLTSADSVMAVIPFCFAYGNSLLTTHIGCGGRLVIENSFLFPATILKRMREEKVTGFAGVPAHYHLLRKYLSSAGEMPSLRYFTQAGGALSWDVIEEYVRLFAKAQFFVMYGQTEASARLSYLDPQMVQKKRGSIGKAITGVELEILNEDRQPVKPEELGEITARGPNIMLGYFNDPEETAKVLKDGRLFTDDLATVDEEGYIYFYSRRSQIIKSGAFRIAPAEIEEAVMNMGGVIECAAVGVPDDILGEAIKLYIVSDSGATLTEEKIRSYLREVLAGYKVPKSVEFVASLKRTPSGKVKRYGLTSEPGGDSGDNGR